MEKEKGRTEAAQGVGDRQIQENVRVVESEPEIRAQTIWLLSFRPRRKPCRVEEGSEEKEEIVMTTGDRPPTEKTAG